MRHLSSSIYVLISREIFPHWTSYVFILDPRAIRRIFSSKVDFSGNFIVCRKYQWDEISRVKGKKIRRAWGQIEKKNSKANNKISWGHSVGSYDEMASSIKLWCSFWDHKVSHQIMFLDGWYISLKKRYFLNSVIKILWRWTWLVEFSELSAVSSISKTSFIGEESNQQNVKTK